MSILNTKFAVLNFSLNGLVTYVFYKKIGNKIFENPKQIQAVVAGALLASLLRSLEPYFENAASYYLSKKNWSLLVHSSSFVIPFLFAIYTKGPVLNSLLTAVGFGLSKEVVERISNRFDFAPMQLISMIQCRRCLISNKKSIHSSAKIHSTVIIEGDVEIGRETIIGPYSYLKGPLKIGAKNQIGANVQIGVDPEHKKKKPCGTVYIGNSNVIREFSVIQRGIGDFDTRIEDNCYIMAYCYIAHDSLIESNSLLCAKASLGGHCRILKGAGLGLGAFLHQFTTIGAHAFVGMGSIVVKDLPPFCIAKGNPAHFLKINESPLEELSLKTRDLAFEDGHLKSEHPYVIGCIEDFKKHSRRQVITTKALKPTILIVG